MESIVITDKSNFLDNYEEVLSHIRGADFVSFDSEFAGLRYTHPLFPDATKFDTNQSIYDRWSFVAQHHGLLQIGLSTYHYQKDKGNFKERNFSFYIHPSGEGPILMKADALTFLCDFKFDFSHCFKNGMTTFQLNRTGILEELITKDDYLQILADYFTREEKGEKEFRDYVYQKHYSAEAVKEAMEIVKKCEEFSKAEGKAASGGLKVPMKCKDTWLYLNDKIEDLIAKIKGFGIVVGVKTKDKESIFEAKKKPAVKEKDAKKGGKDKGATAEKVEGEMEEEGEDASNAKEEDASLTATTAEAQTQPDVQDETDAKKAVKSEAIPEKLVQLDPEVQNRRKLIEFLLPRTGFSLVFLELLRTKKVMVGHSCLFDWMYLMRNCYDNLPKTLIEFGATLQKHFPIIWDTKLLGSYATKFDSKVHIKLEKMYNYFKKECPNKPNLVETVNFPSELQHDAGYDSSITGFCFVHMIAILGVLKSPMSSCPQLFRLETSEFNKLVDLYNKMYIVIPDREIDLAHLDGGGECQNEVICGQICGERRDDEIIACLEEIERVACEEVTFCFYKVNRNNFYLHVRFSTADEIKGLIGKLNEKFEGKAKFSDFYHPLIESTDRFWLSRMGYL